MPKQACLPPHGRIPCRKCFSTAREVEEIASWRVVNDPGAWGSDHASILVLGFSKGFTQASAYQSDAFEAIPFKGTVMRSRLTAALRRIGALSQIESVSEKFLASERDFAFGSLVRCSLSRLNKKGEWECTGQVMPLAFTEPVRAVVRRCAETYLGDLPASVRLVVMLGSGDPYIKGCRGLIRSLYGSAFKDVNEVAYRTSDIVWVHIAHPSPGNGYFTLWMQGASSDPSGRKLLQALSALSALSPSIRQAA